MEITRFFCENKCIDIFSSRKLADLEHTYDVRLNDDPGQVMSFSQLCSYIWDVFRTFIM